MTVGWRDRTLLDLLTEHGLDLLPGTRVPERRLVRGDLH